MRECGDRNIRERENTSYQQDIGISFNLVEDRDGRSHNLKCRDHSAGKTRIILLLFIPSPCKVFAEVKVMLLLSRLCHVLVLS